MDDLNETVNQQRKQHERMDNSYDLDALFRQNAPLPLNDNRAEVERHAREMWAA